MDGMQNQFCGEKKVDKPQVFLTASDPLRILDSDIENDEFPRFEVWANT